MKPSYVIGILLVLGLATTVAPGVAQDKLYPIERLRDETTPTGNRVQHHSLGQPLNAPVNLAAEREKRWSLPTKALAEFDTTIQILVLRFDFQYETIDNPNTTGRGLMDRSRPLDNPSDSAAYYNQYGHWIDPPPHDSLYFDAHMRSLQKYWETVSEGRITLDWDIYPPGPDSTYQLPYAMDHYGICFSGLPEDQAFDTVVFGLEQYFRDCFKVADSVSPELDFGQYRAFFIFHAGSDQQNDLGFPPTCSDLFTGFISYRTDDTLWVDEGATRIYNALIMPESMNQDNRGTAMNAVVAHEFGHQLGLVDLYSTNNFTTSIGDFALMDHNGFGTAVDFGFAAGGIKGTIPLYPCAWSRAYLGLVEVADFREGTDIKLAAAEVLSEGIKVARVPISENEYYLLENRVVDPDGRTTALLADSATSVILWPVDQATRAFVGEYDYLMPGSGLIIYHVDEGVAGLDYDRNGVSNFDDNQLQLNPYRRFVRVVEADGFVDMSGYYEIGSRRYGSAADMYRDGNNRNFTPNTNPPAIDNSGNNTRVRITDIQRAIDTTGPYPRRMDTLMQFSVEIDGLVEGFPVRAGAPRIPFSPIGADLNLDGSPEVLVVSDDRLLVMTPDGGNFLHQVSQCNPCITYYDTAIASVHTGQIHPVPLFFTNGDAVTAAPVVGDFGDSAGIGFRLVALATTGQVTLLTPADGDGDGLADWWGWEGRISMSGATPVAMVFGERLWILNDRGEVFLKSQVSAPATLEADLDDHEFDGLAGLDDALVVLAGDSIGGVAEPETRVHVIHSGQVFTHSIPGRLSLGPILADLDRDGAMELVAMSRSGDAVAVTIEMNITMPPVATPVFTRFAEAATGRQFTTNPVVADVDSDGYPDVIVGGVNVVYAFDGHFVLKTGFPLEVSDRYVDDDVIASPIVADIRQGGMPEIVFPTLAGNLYSLGPDISYGFPLSAGELGVGSPLVYSHGDQGRLAYLGADGWFYAWETDALAHPGYWPMYGSDPAGTFCFDSTRLGAPAQYAEYMPEERFYNYPNPVRDGSTTIRYFLGRDAERAEMIIYDLSGREVRRLSGPTAGGTDNETVWDCSGVTPGVYRCRLEVDFGGRTDVAFTDIAIIR